MNRLALSRRRLIAGSASLGGLMLAGCDRLSNSPSFKSFIGHGEDLTFASQRLLLTGQPLAKEFAPSQVSRVFRVNGSSQPSSDE